MQPNVVNNLVKVSQEHTHVIVKGAGGLQGLPGPAGAGLEIDGSVDTYSDLPHHLTPSDAGVAYFVQADGLLYIWTGERWPEEGQGAQFQGPRGIQGPPGVPGVDGRDGEDGAPGPANSLSIGVVQTGATAGATITGTPPSQTLNLTLPKGDPGEDAYIPTEQAFKDAALNIVYPVGSIYMSVNNVSPETFMGGTWEQIKDTFLLSAGDTYAAGSAGGEAEHTLTIDEMPSHNHTQNQHRHLISSHSNSYGTGTTAGYRSPSIDQFHDYNQNSYTDYQTPTINNRGGGLAHNNMPPYLTVYMWKRTA